MDDWNIPQQLTMDDWIPVRFVGTSLRRWWFSWQPSQAAVWLCWRRFFTDNRCKECGAVSVLWPIGILEFLRSSRILEMDNHSRMSHLHCIDNPLSYVFVQLPMMLVWISIFWDQKPYLIFFDMFWLWHIWTGNMSSTGRIGIVSEQSHFFTTYSAFSTCLRSPIFFLSVSNYVTGPNAFFVHTIGSISRKHKTHVLWTCHITWNFKT